MTRQRKNELAAKEIFTDFLISYADKPKSVTDKSWLEDKISAHLPKIPRKKIQTAVNEMLTQSYKVNLAIENIFKSADFDCTSEIWFYKEMLKKYPNATEDTLQDIFTKNQTLEDINLWLAEILDYLNKINFDDEEKFFYEEEDFEDFSYDDKKISSAKKSANKIKDKKFLTKEAVGNNLHKALANQVQRTLRTDLGHLNLKSHDIDDLAMSLGKNAALNGVGGMAVTTLLTVIMQSGFKSKGKAEIIKLLMQSGTTQGIKTATAGALKVVAEKGLLPVLNRTTPLIVIATLSVIMIESFKIIIQREKGKINSLEAADKIGRVTTAAIFSVGFATAGRVAGIAVFSLIPLAGPVVGGIVGSLIGELTGSIIGGKIGDFSYTKAKNLFAVFNDVVKLDTKAIAIATNLKNARLTKQKISLLQ